MLYNSEVMKKLAVLPLFALIITACNQTGPVSPTITQSIQWNIDGTPTTMTVPPGVFSSGYLSNETSIAGLTADNKFDIRFIGPQVPGTYPASRFVLYSSNKYFVQQFPFDMDITITNYGGPGEYIVGSFNGTVRDSASTATFPASGTFRLRN